MDTNQPAQGRQFSYKKPKTYSAEEVLQSKPKTYSVEDVMGTQERSLVGDIATNVGRGVADTAELAGHALKTVGAEDTGQWLVDKAEQAHESSFLAPDKSEQEGSESFVKEGVMGGVRSFVPSGSSFAAGFAAGAGVGSLFGPGPGTLAGGLVGAGMGALGLFGAGIYGKEKQRALDAGLSEQEAHTHGLQQGLVEGGIEMVSTPLEILTGGVGKVATQPIKHTIKELMKTPLKQVAKNYAKTMGVEVSTEMLQSGLGNELAKTHGLEEGATSEAVLGSIIPAMTMSLMFGMGTQAYSVYDRKKFQQRLSSPETDMKQRASDANAIYHAIAKEDPELAVQWAEAAQQAVSYQQPIDIDENFAEFAATRPRAVSQDERDNTINKVIDSASAELGDMAGTLNQQQPGTLEGKTGYEDYEAGKQFDDEYTKQLDKDWKEQKQAAAVYNTERNKKVEKQADLDMVRKTIEAIRAADADQLAEMGSKMGDFLAKNPEYERFKTSFRQEFHARNRQLSGKKGAEQVISAIGNEQPVQAEPVVQEVPGDPEMETPKVEQEQEYNEDFRNLSQPGKYQDKTGNANDFLIREQATAQDNTSQSIDSDPTDALIRQNAPAATTQQIESNPNDTLIRQNTPSDYATPQPGELAEDYLKRISGQENAQQQLHKKEFPLALVGKEVTFALPTGSSSLRPTKQELLIASKKLGISVKTARKALDYYNNPDGFEIGVGKEKVSILQDSQPQISSEPGSKEGSANTSPQETRSSGAEVGGKKNVHDYSNTQVRVAGKPAQKIVEFGKRIPDSELYLDPQDPSYGREEEPHITVRYGLATDNPQDLAKLSELPSIKAKLGEVSIFETDNYDVVKAEVDSDSLKAANKKVGELVELPGETFKDYQPHATIAYVKKGEGKKYVGDKSLEGLEINVDAIDLTARDGSIHTIKLEGDEEKTPQSPAKASDKAPKSERKESAQARIEKETTKQPEDSNPSVAIAERVQASIKNQVKITYRQLFKWADEAYKGTQSEGKYNVKDAYDALELGINKLLLSSSDSLNTITPSISSTPQENVSRLEKLMFYIPTQSKRTEEMDEFQQFSTPPPFAYMANWVANINKNDTYLEPSAGVGGLAVFGKKAGATVIVNELSDRRRSLIKNLNFDRVTAENAEHLNSILPKDIQPTVIVMNPPFSATAGRIKGKRATKIGAQHIEQALKRLQPGGRLVAIVGEGMAHDKTSFKPWWKKIESEYTVRANIGVSGKGYRKYGTTFDNQILVIDKLEPKSDNIVKTGKVETPADLAPLLEDIRNERTTIQQQQVGTVQQEETSRGQGTSQADGPGNPISTSTDSMESGNREGGTRGQNQLPVSGNTGQADVPNQTGESSQVSGADRTQHNEENEQESTTNRGSKRTGRTPAQQDSSNNTRVQPSNTVESLDLEEKTQGKSTIEISTSLYEGYRPERVKISGAKPHPTPLVQSAAMASVPPPKPTYSPSLPKKAVTSGNISDIQLESVVYAGQAHEQMLPNGERQGYFIGDGTGVGKGREIASIIWDNWNKGRTKAVWISEKAPLFKDAQRDAEGVGWDGSNIFELKKTKIDKDIPNTQGVMFTTYDTLKMPGKSGQQSRIDQIVNWLGKDFDGVIAFDEAHNMGNAIRVKGERGYKEPSKKALAGVDLQQALPKARVVYVSATGATEVNNLAYADRLGVWGEGTAFANKQSFVNDVSAGGVAAMELVARDIKAMGVYNARSLSYDGVGYERLEHTLTKNQHQAYNTVALAWQNVLQEINAALEETGGGGRAKGATYSAFWGAHQRFFNQFITSLQMPSVLKEIKKDIEKGNAVVIQMTNTFEAAQDRAVAKLESGQSLEDLDISPFDSLMMLVEKSFPVTQYQQYEDDNGNIRWEPVKDSEGNIVENAEAVAMREKLLDELGSLRSQVADNPLDQIIDEFGHEKVAEVTGRSRRFVWVNEDGAMVKKEQKRGNTAGPADAQAFMDDKKQILIFSDAGGTGRSYHADNNAKNKRKRVHYLLQPGWRADKAIQGLGRTHRSNQAQPPLYKLVTTNLKGQKRFLSSIARRLEQLGALTKGQRQTGNQGIFNARDNLESQYAKDALRQFFGDLFFGRIEGLTIARFELETGLKLTNEETGQLTQNLPDIRQFLNRLLSLDIETQDLVFDAFSQRIDDIIETHVRAGTLDQGVETLVADKVEKVSETLVNRDDRTGAETTYVQLKTERPAKRLPFSGSRQYAKDGYYQNKTSGKVWAVTYRHVQNRKTGDVVEMATLISPSMRRQNIPKVGFTDEKWTKVNSKQAKPFWERDYSSAPSTITDTEHLLTGALLPIWDRLSGNARVMRVQTNEGEKMIGRLIPSDDINNVLSSLGVDAKGNDATVQVTPQQAFSMVLDQNFKIKLANGWTLERKRVSDDDRIEIKNGFNLQDMQNHSKHGVFSERIQWQTRFFVPTSVQGVQSIEKLMVRNPVVSATPPAGSKYGAADGESIMDALDGDTKLSKSTTTSTLANIHQELTSALGRKLNRLLRGSLHIVGQDEAQEILGSKLSKTDTVQGFVKDRNVYLVQDGIEKGKAMSVLAHEMGVHLNKLGFKQDKAFQRVLNSIKRNQGKSTKLGKLINEAASRVPSDTNAEHHTEEILAYLVENNPDTGIVRRFIALVKRWLVEKVGISAGIFNADDLHALAMAAIDQQAGIGTSERVKMSVQDKFKPVDLEQAIDDNRDELYDILLKYTDSGPFDGGCVIAANGIQQAIGGEVVVLTRPNGKADHAAVKIGDTLYDFDGPAKISDFISRFNSNEMSDTNGIRPIEKNDLPDAPRNSKASTEIANVLATKQTPFQKWFGNSKITKNGQPHILYHGTQDPQFLSDKETPWVFDTKRKPNKISSPLAGLGIFLGDADIAAAHSGFNGTVHPFYVKMENPYVTTSAELEKKVEQSGTKQFKKRLQELSGHDGIIITDRGHAVVFEPNQVKSATENTGAYSLSNDDVRYSIKNDVKKNGLDVKKETAFAKAIAKASEKIPQGESVKAWFNRLSRKSQEKMLPLLTLRQLRDIYGKDLFPVEQFYTGTRELAAETNRIMQRGDERYNQWASLSRVEQNKLSLIMTEATVKEVDPSKPLSDKKKKDPEKIKAHKKLVRQYNRLSPEAREVFEDVRDTYSDNLEHLRNALLERLVRTLVRKDKELAKELYAHIFHGKKITPGYLNNLISKSTGTGAAVIKYMEQVRLKFEKFIEDGPYFPLSRFGQYQVTIKKEGEDFQRHHFESQKEHDDFVAEKKAEGWTVKSTTSKDFNKELQGATPGFATDVINLLNQSQDISAEEKNRLSDEINQMFIKSMPDLSHRKHFAHRQKVEGYSRNQMRAFAEQVQHAAHHIARIKHGDKLTMALEKLDKNIRNTKEGDTIQQQQVYNELSKRYNQITEPKISPVAQALTSFGFAWNIGPSIASAVVNLTQTPLVAYPVMAARFKSWKGAADMLAKATQQYFSSPFEKDKGFNLAHNEQLPEEERELLEKLIDDGTIDVTQAHDLAQAAGQDFLNLAKSKHGHNLLRVMRVVSYPFHVAEVANRQITAIAAYRMARKNGQHHKEAINTTREIVLDSHFDYSQANRARFMEGNMQRVLFLFKQYSQQMTYLLGRSFQQAVKGESQEVKDMARKQLAGILGGHFIVSGMLGMPVVGGIAEVMQMIVNAFGDDDEPWDWEVSLRNALADTVGVKGGEALAKGPFRALPLLGQLDISSRVSLGDLWLRKPNREVEGRDKYYQYLETFLGPLSRNAGDMVSGLSSMSDGHFYRGVEMMLPKAVKDGMKTVRYSREGIKSWNDATLVEELRYMELFGQVLGFTPASVSEMYAGKNAIKNHEHRLNNRRQQLINRWVYATQHGRTNKANRIFKEIVTFNKKNPIFMIRPDTTLRTSLRNRQRSQRNTERGVYMPTTKQALREQGRFASI